MNRRAPPQSPPRDPVRLIAHELEAIVREAGGASEETLSARMAAATAKILVRTVEDERRRGTPDAEIAIGLAIGLGWSAVNVAASLLGPREADVFRTELVAAIKRFLAAASARPS